MKKMTAKAVAVLATLTLSVGTMSATPSYAAYADARIGDSVKLAGSSIESTAYTEAFAAPGDVFEIFGGKFKLVFDEYCRYYYYYDGDGCFYMAENYQNPGYNSWLFYAGYNGTYRTAHEEWFPFTIYEDSEELPEASVESKYGKVTIDGILFCAPDDQLVTTSTLCKVTTITGDNPDTDGEEWHATIITKKHYRQLCRMALIYGHDFFPGYRAKTLDQYYIVLYPSTEANNLPTMLRAIGNPYPKPQQ